VLFPCTGRAIGFEGFGAKAAFVIPDGPIDNAIGFGALATFGSIFSRIPALHAEAGADYWGKSYTNSAGNEVDFSSTAINGTAKYYFTSGGISPFAGAGTGVAFSKSSFAVEVPGFEEASDTSTKFGFHLCGGIDIPIGAGFKFTAEGRYTSYGGDVKGDGNTVQIIGAFVVKLK